MMEAVEVYLTLLGLLYGAFAAMVAAAFVMKSVEIYIMNKIDWERVGNWAGFIALAMGVGVLTVVTVIPSTLLSGAYMGMTKFKNAVNRKEEDTVYDAYLHPLDLIASFVLLFGPSNVKARMAALFAKSDPSDIAPIVAANASMGGEDDKLHSVDDPDTSVDKTDNPDAKVAEG